MSLPLCVYFHPTLRILRYCLFILFGVAEQLYYNDHLIFTTFPFNFFARQFFSLKKNKYQHFLDIGVPQGLLVEQPAIQLVTDR